MKIVDKILISLASISIFGMVLVFTNQGFSSESHGPRFSSSVEASRVQAGRGSVPSQEENQTGSIVEATQDVEMVVYSKEIDEVIEHYFSTIQENPGQAEEEERLMDSNSEGDEAPETFANTTSPEEQRPAVSIHVVQKGDSLWRIARKYGIPVYTITSMNPSRSSSMIRPGDRLRIPDRAGVEYVVKKGDSLNSISLKHKSELKKIRSYNSIQGDVIHPGQKLFLPGGKPGKQYRFITKRLFIWPIQGRLSSRYGMRIHPVHKKKQFHTGIDISANRGTKIRAAADGIVVFAGNGGSYGKMVVLRHKNGYFTVYAHAHKVLVKKGQYVKQGGHIALVGSTGMATGAHLHFEVKKINKKVDPLSALKMNVKVKVPVS